MWKQTASTILQIKLVRARYWNGASEHLRAEFRRFLAELFEQLSVAGVGQQGSGSGVPLQLLIQVGDGEGVHHLLLYKTETHQKQIIEECKTEQNIQEDKYTTC